MTHKESLPVTPRADFADAIPSVPKKLTEEVVWPEEEQLGMLHDVLEAISIEISTLEQNPDDDLAIEALQELIAMVPYEAFLKLDEGRLLRALNTRRERLMQQVLTITPDRATGRISSEGIVRVQRANDEIDYTYKCERLIESVLDLRDEVARFWSKKGFKRRELIAPKVEEVEVVDEEEQTPSLTTEELADEVLDILTSLPREEKGGQVGARVDAVKKEFEGLISPHEVEKAIGYLAKAGIVQVKPMGSLIYIFYDEVKTHAPHESKKIDVNEKDIALCRDFILELFATNDTKSLKKNFLTEQARKTFDQNTAGLAIGQLLEERRMVERSVKSKPRYILVSRR